MYSIIFKDNYGKVQTNQNKEESIQRFDAQLWKIFTKSLCAFLVFSVIISYYVKTDVAVLAIVTASASVCGLIIFTGMLFSAIDFVVKLLRRWRNA